MDAAKMLSNPEIIKNIDFAAHRLDENEMYYFRTAVTRSLEQVVVVCTDPLDQGIMEVQYASGITTGALNALIATRGASHE